jgi:hypothetical protein
MTVDFKFGVVVTVDSTLLRFVEVGVDREDEETARWTLMLMEEVEAIEVRRLDEGVLVFCEEVVLELEGVRGVCAYALVVLDWEVALFRVLPPLVCEESSAMVAVVVVVEGTALRVFLDEMREVKIATAF